MPKHEKYWLYDDGKGHQEFMLWDDAGAWTPARKLSKLQRFLQQIRRIKRRILALFQGAQKLINTHILKIIV